MFFARAAQRGDSPFLHRRAAGQWQAISWAEAARQVASLAAALSVKGVMPGDRVMLVSENRPEFCIADLAIMAIGAVSVPTYITNTTRDHAHIIADSGASAVIWSGGKIAKALLPAVLASDIRLGIAMEPEPLLQSGAVEMCGWQALIDSHPADVDALAAAQRSTRADTACIIYTSGTGGAPRGVLQHHGAILANVEGCADIILADFAGGEEIFLSFLPLSHSYEHSAGQFLPIGLGGQIYYAEGLEKLAANIEEVRPTIMVVVPRLFEMLRGRLTRAVEQQGGLATWLLERALAQGEHPPVWQAPLTLLLERTIRKKIRQRFGGRLKALVSGGAALSPEVGGFFGALGLTILQGYGQSESGPVISCNRPRVGIDHATVGPPLKDVEVRIAEDGEILVRGEVVMHGYWNNPAETRRALQDGWLHTGDIGTIDAAGRLKITDRKKDIIVNDKGDTIAPQRIEGLLSLEPEIAQAMVRGDRRPYLVGLIVPDPALSPESAEDAVRAAVDRVNATLSVTERVRRFALADEPFGIDNGEMTPSLKIRRHVIAARYAERLDALYGSA